MEKEVISNAIFKISPSEILISGPPEFVKEQSDKYNELISTVVSQMFAGKQLANSGNPKNLTLVSSKQVKQENTEEAEFIEITKPSLSNYENALVVTDGRVQIIKDIPGKSVAHRMINLVLIYMFAKMQLGVDEIYFSEIRQFCEHYGEFDSSNFARYINGQKRYFLVSGSGKSQRAKLIRPGVKEAESLLEQMNK